MSFLNKKRAAFLIVVAFSFSLIIPVSLAWPFFSSEPEEKITLATGFYDEIGTLYTTKTSDNINIKMLRYHAPGEDFNYGAQPLLLFPGILENMNQFLQHSTKEIKELFDVQLPEDLADWAVGDEKIEEDPMLYYSIAYYLWKIGYDPWFGNYRGTGLGEARSQDGGSKTSLDVFGLYDVRAGIRKVYEVTGLHPVIGGHSTGGLGAIMHLQGCDFSWTGHVKSYNTLVKERNGDTKGPETVKGFIGLDPAWIPGMTNLLDNPLIWGLLYTDLVIDLRSIIETIITLPLVSDVMPWILKLITEQYGEDVNFIFREMVNLDATNVNDAWIFYLLAYTLDTLYLRTLAQYLDFIANDRVREFFRNGILNNVIISPPKPRWLDGYYYYDKNMANMKVPSIIFLAEMENEVMDLVDADKVISGVIDAKTPNVNDEHYFIPGAHIDMPAGFAAPIELFPKLGDWLAKI